MNEALKSIVDLGIAVGQAGVDAVEKKSLAVILLDLEKSGMDVAAVIANAGTVKAEMAALPGSDQEKDLIAYVAGKVAGLTGDAHAQAVIQASLKLAADLAADLPVLVSLLSAPKVAGPTPDAPPAA